jgi:hypothetical protein
LGPLSLVLWATWVVVAAAPAAAQTATDHPVTFSKDIAPILQRSCQRCHRPDSVAPMSLITYEQVRPYAREIKRRTALRDVPWSRGVMPPWFLERTIGVQKIKDDISLSDGDLATIAKWVDSGAPEGDPKDLPPALTFADAATWTLGKPDLVVSSPTVLVPAVASDWSRFLGRTPTGLTEDRYARSSEYKEVSEFTAGKRPAGAGTIGSLFAIHHMNTIIDNTGDANADVTDTGGEVQLRDNIPNHEVGRNGDVYPEDAGRSLKKGSTIIWNNIHIHSAGLPGSERRTRLDLGFQFHPRGYQPKYTFHAYSFARTELQVGPGESDHREDAYFVAPQAMKLTDFEPHMHANGVRMCIEAIYARTVETLNCAGYDHNWVRIYYYDDNAAPLIPKGTILHAISWFDNTAKNQNVIDPRNLATFGNSSVNNMFIVFNHALFLTDEQYIEEVAKRKQYLARTGEENIGCIACYLPLAKPANGTK